MTPGGVLNNISGGEREEGGRVFVVGEEGGKDDKVTAAFDWPTDVDKDAASDAARAGDEAGPDVGRVIGLGGGTGSEVVMASRRNLELEGRDGPWLDSRYGFERLLDRLFCSESCFAEALAWRAKFFIRLFMEI